MIPRGLCESCCHAQQIASSRGSVFIRCNLSFGDPRFARYPALPVLQCDGYTRARSPQDERASGTPFASGSQV